MSQRPLSRHLSLPTVASATHPPNALSRHRTVASVYLEVPRSSAFRSITFHNSKVHRPGASPLSRASSASTITSVHAQRSGTSGSQPPPLTHTASLPTIQDDVNDPSCPPDLKEAVDWSRLQKKNATSGPPSDDGTEVPNWPTPIQHALLLPVEPDDEDTSADGTVRGFGATQLPSASAASRTFSDYSGDEEVLSHSGKYLVHMSSRRSITLHTVGRV